MSQIYFTVKPDWRNGKKLTVEYLKPERDIITIWTYDDSEWAALQNFPRYFEEEDTAREAFFIAYPEAQYVGLRQFREIYNGRQSKPESACDRKRGEPCRKRRLRKQ